MILRYVVGRRPTPPSALRRTARYVVWSCLALFGTSLFAAEPVDWYQWRGPEGNGISREKNLPDAWSTTGDNVLWSKEEYSTRSTPIVNNGKLYIVSRYKPDTTEEQEQLVCLNAETGELIWRQAHNVYLSDAPAERVGWSSPIADPTTGNIFWLGLGCHFQCLNGEDGSVLWEHSMSEEYGMLSTYGGRTNFPVIYDDLVIISGVMTQWGEHAIPAHRFVAFDKRTGAAVWFEITRPKPEDTTYSTPFLTVFDGQAAMVFGGGDGFMYAMQPRTGEVIWKYDCSNRGINTPPLVVDGSVYCGHREQNSANTRILGAIFAINGDKAKGEIKEDELKWKLPGRSVEGSQPVLIDGRLYVIEDNGTLVVINPDNGDIIQEKRIGRKPGSMIYGDGKLYCCDNSGNLWVLQPSEDGVEEVSHVRLRGEEVYSSPIINHGKIYLATTKALYCIGDKGVKPEADPIPPKPQETPVSEDREIAHIQLAPVEAMLVPGTSTPYQVRGYNKRGQFVKLVDAEFSIDGGGEMSTDGRYTAPTGDAHLGVMITAKVNDLTSTARARILPDLPWKFDFAEKKVPLTWIGADYRHKAVDLDGEPVLVKVSTIPKGARSQSWMGWPTLHDYTIQADFRSTANSDNGRRADMGLINQRYTLDMMDKGRLELRSWTSRVQQRFGVDVPFEWETDEWYTLKFQSENKDGKAMLRGKAWKRGEEEPKEWMIEGVDAVPNTIGSPGMFGNAQIAEYYIDNVEVYYNEN